MRETRRLKLIVSYDGGDFAGWQSQSHGNTIQDHLETGFAKISGGRIGVAGAGRTDAGVHALGQCAHADVPREKMSAADWVAALNGTLPRAIRILRARFVSGSFHARFSARAKLYRYRIANTAILSPFEAGRVWHLTRALDVGVLEEGAALFAGRHDFGQFAANRGNPESDTVRTIKEARISCRGEGIITLEFSGDGFLYKMVRMMVGALVRCALGKDSLASITLRLQTPSHRDPATGHSFGDGKTLEKISGGEPLFPAPDTRAPTELRAARSPGPPMRRGIARLVAPAEGLYLVRVRY